MAVDLIAQAAAKIEKRLSELSKERQEIERVLQRLDAVGVKPEARRSSKRPRKRARPGQRRQQFIDAVKNQPGITVSQIAKGVDTTPNPLYVLARQLLGDGTIKKEGSGYRISDDKAAGKKKSARKTRTKRRGKSKR